MVKVKFHNVPCLQRSKNNMLINYRRILLGLLLVVGPLLPSFAAASCHKAITQSIAPEQLQGYKNYSPAVKVLIEQSLKLAQCKLTYMFGSADPKNRGMDCSGTLHYLLKHLNIKDVPRSSYEMYLWVLKQGKLHT